MKNSSNYKGKYRNGQKTMGDKTGMDCTQWIVTDHRQTRGASEDQWHEPYIVTAAWSVYRTVHLRIYEAYQNQRLLSHNSLHACG